jgi:hypothetical protein
MTEISEDRPYRNELVSKPIVYFERIRTITLNVLIDLGDIGIDHPLAGQILSRQLFLNHRTTVLVF